MGLIDDDDDVLLSSKIGDRILKENRQNCWEFLFLSKIFLHLLAQISLIGGENFLHHNVVIFEDMNFKDNKKNENWMKAFRLRSKYYQIPQTFLMAYKFLGDMLRKFLCSVLVCCTTSLILMQELYMLINW